VKVQFYATLRPIVGGKTIELPLHGGVNAGTLLHGVCADYPALNRFVWAADGRLSELVKVFVDGREIRHLQALDTQIPEGATVDIFPPVAGG
jgi:molybdopterin synthase sulfur carrier subunit